MLLTWRLPDGWLGRFNVFWGYEVFSRPCGRVQFRWNVKKER